MKAVADNTAFIVATKIATYSYNEGLPSYTLTGNKTITGTTYSPLQDFNNMMSGYDMIESGSTEIRVEWDNNNRIVTVDIGPFKTVYGDNITPYRQAASIEDR